jgi:hypothetical protein
MTNRAALSAHLNAFLLCPHRQPLVGHYPDGAAADPRIRRHERFAVVRLVLVHRVCVHDSGEQIARVVRFVSIETD